MQGAEVHIQLLRVGPLPDDPGAALDDAWYHLTVDGGAPRAVSIPWSKGWLQDLSNLRRREQVGAALRRLGAQLARMLEDAGWGTARARLRQARKEGKQTRVIIESDASELFRLPWELVPVDSKGTPLQAVLDAPIRYTWPNQTAHPQQDSERGAGLVVVTGPDPLIDAHRASLRSACGPMGLLDPERDFFPNLPLEALQSQVSAHAAAGSPLTLLHLVGRAGGSETRPVMALGPDRPDLTWTDQTATSLLQALEPGLAHLQVVVLNLFERNTSEETSSGHVAIAQAFHRAGIPAVIAPRWPLSPEGAERLSEVFLRALLRELTTVEEAFLAAFRTLARDGRPGDAAALQLYLPRSQGPLRPLRLQPYPGLLPYGPDRNALFFGRDRETEEVVRSIERLQQGGRPRIFAIIGAPYVGKTSLALAGVLPALRSHGVPWVHALLRPGQRPLQALDAVISAERPAGAQLLLVVDQAEELFEPRPTDNRNPDQRDERPDLTTARLFLNRLWRLAASGGSGVTVLLTLRIEAMGRCAAVLIEDTGQQLDAVLYDEQHRLFLRDPEPSQLQEMVGRPAATLGLKFEADLAARLVFDAGTTQGALPRLSLILMLLWDDAHGELLSRSVWSALGGVTRVVSQFADRSIAELDTESEREEARLLLISLVEILPSGALRRKSRPEADLLARPPAERPLADKVRAHLQRRGLLRRLLLPGAEPELQRASWELSTEVLLQEWPRLKTWLQRPQTSAPAGLPPGTPSPTGLPNMEPPTTRSGQNTGRTSGPGRLGRSLWTGGIAVLFALGLAWWSEQPPESPGGEISAERALEDPTRAALHLRQTDPLRRESDWVQQANLALQAGVAARSIDHGGLAIEDGFFSPDGNQLAVLSGEVLHLYTLQADSPPVLIKPPPADGGVVAAHFLPSGTALRTVARSGAVHLWSLDGTDSTLQRPGATNRTPVAAFSPDGSQLLLATREGWELLGPTGQVLGTGTIPSLKDGAADLPVALAVDDAAHRWAVATTGGRIHLFEAPRTPASPPKPPRTKTVKARRGKPLPPPPDPTPEAPVTLLQEGVAKLEINGVGTHLLAVGSGVMRIIDLDRRAGSARTPKQVEVDAAIFSPDGQLVVVDYLDTETGEHHARAKPLEGRTNHWTSPALQGAASALGLDPVHQRLYRGSPEGRVVEVDLATTRLRRSFRGHRTAIRGVIVDPKGRWLATAGEGGLVRLWDLRPEKGNMVHYAPLPVERGQPAVLSADGLVLAGIDADRTLWSAVDSAQPKDRGPAPDLIRQMRAVTWADQSRILAVTDDAIHVWDDQPWKAPLEGKVLHIAPGGERIAVVEVSGLRILRARPGETIENLRLPGLSEPVSAAFDPAGQWLAVGLTDGSARILDSFTGREERAVELLREPVARICVSTDANTLAAAGLAGGISIWKKDLTEPVQLELPLPDIRTCTLSPDGSKLLVSGETHTLGIRLPEGEILFRAASATPTLGEVATFTGDGAAALVISHDGSLRRWVMEEADLQRRLWAESQYCGDPTEGREAAAAWCACEACFGRTPEACEEVPVTQRTVGAWCPQDPGKFSPTP